MRIAFTGHRPDKLPDGYGKNEKLRDFIEECLCKKLDSLDYGLSHIKVITGGAIGIDQIAANAALCCKYYGGDYEEQVHVVIAEPFKFFWQKWPPQTVEDYFDLRHRVDDFFQVCEPGYAPWKMQKRNEYMVDNCDELWAYWDGSDGGTKNCIDYAKKKGVKIRNLYEEFAI